MEIDRKDVAPAIRIENPDEEPSDAFLDALASLLVQAAERDLESDETASGKSTSVGEVDSFGFGDLTSYTFMKS